MRQHYFLQRMAIEIKLEKTETNLFCSSKWWGNPDLPPDAEYPMMKVSGDGEEGEYPLTFICQIDCEDIAPLDKDGLLPHEGMLYFFAAIDDFNGYESPEHFPAGAWPAKAVRVKYAKQINMETFNSCILVDEDDNDLAEEALKMTFSEGGSGLTLLGSCCTEDGVSLLHLVTDEVAGLHFPDGKSFDILIKESDLRFGNWKKAFGCLK